MFQSFYFRLCQKYTQKNTVKFLYLHVVSGTRRSNLGYDYFLSNHATTWYAAVHACRRMGMRLARIDSLEEHNWVFQTFGQGKPWIGLNDRRREGHFVNSDGCPKPFIKWASGQPDNHRNGEDCVQLSTKLGMNDNRCTRRLRFLCKKSDASVRSRCGAPIYSK